MGVSKLPDERSDEQVLRLIAEYETLTADALRRAEQTRDANQKAYCLRLAKAWAELATALKACG